MPNNAALEGGILESILPFGRPREITHFGRGPRRRWFQTPLGLPPKISHSAADYNVNGDSLAIRLDPASSSCAKSEHVQ